MLLAENSAASERAIRLRTEGATADTAERIVNEAARAERCWQRSASIVEAARRGAGAPADSKEGDSEGRSPSVKNCTDA